MMEVSLRELNMVLVGPLDDGGITEGTQHLHSALPEVLQCVYLVCGCSVGGCALLCLVRSIPVRAASE